MTHTNRNFMMATAIAAALTGLTAPNAIAKDGSPTLEARTSVQSGSVSTATAEVSKKTPSKNRYGKHGKR